MGLNGGGFHDYDDILQKEKMVVNRRIQIIFTLLTVVLLGLGSCSGPEPVLKIGLVADPQYENKNTAGKRYYRESLWKLGEAIDTFNFYNVDFVQNLGDIINSKNESFGSIMPVYDKLNSGIQSYHLFGNHDFAVDSVDMPGLIETLLMPDHYYSYVKKNWRFIVLNSMDFSYLANPLYNRDTALINEYFNATMDQANHYDWNGAIGKVQQEWLKNELKEAESNDEDVIVFSHMPLLPFEVEERLWNSDEIVTILEDSPNVKAYINGHRHKGGYAFENGIHYISIFGMVDTEISSYAILEIYNDSLVLKGYGNQENKLLILYEE